MYICIYIKDAFTGWRAPKCGNGSLRPFHSKSGSKRLLDSNASWGFNKSKVLKLGPVQISPLFFCKLANCNLLNQVSSGLGQVRVRVNWFPLWLRLVRVQLSQVSKFKFDDSHYKRASLQGPKGDLTQLGLLKLTQGGTESPPHVQVFEPWYKDVGVKVDVLINP